MVEGEVDCSTHGMCSGPKSFVKLSGRRLNAIDCLRVLVEVEAQ